MVELGICGDGAGASSGGGPRPRRVGIDDPPERGHARTVPATQPRQRRTLARVPTRYDVDRDALAGILAGEPRYRVGQVWDGLYRQLASPAELTALPRPLRARLDHDLPAALAAVTESIDGPGATVKWLFGLDGGARIETVLMHYRDRTTVCVSTQAGCAMACGFCATGQAGFQRHLSTGEIVEQIVRAARRARDDGRRLGNVVFMGMGEPLANYDRVWPAVERAHGGLGLSARHLTLSTVGLVPGIRRLATEDLPVNLAVSLHAANDGLRDELVPINRRYPLSVLVGACADYVRAKGRRLSFEWALIDGTNDRRTDARELAELARGSPLPAHVNLIPLNPTPGYPTRGTPPDGVRRFRRWLRDLGVNATVRRNRGADIDAACGQLAAARRGAGRAAVDFAPQVGPRSPHQHGDVVAGTDGVEEPLPAPHAGARPHDRAHHLAIHPATGADHRRSPTGGQVRRQVPGRCPAVEARAVPADDVDLAGVGQRSPRRLVEAGRHRRQPRHLRPGHECGGDAATGAQPLAGAGQRQPDPGAVGIGDERGQRAGAPGVTVEDQRRAAVDPRPQSSEGAGGAERLWFLDRYVNPAVEVRLDGLTGVMDVDRDGRRDRTRPLECVVDERHAVHRTERLGEHPGERAEPRPLAGRQHDGAHVGCACAGRIGHHRRHEHHPRAGSRELRS